MIKLSRYRKDQRLKEKIKIKWRIHKRRMKSSKRRDEKFERGSGELNITDYVDQIKFYSRLSVRKASSISKQVNLKCKLFSSKNNQGIWNINSFISKIIPGKENKREREDTEGETSKKRRFQWVRKTHKNIYEFLGFQWKKSMNFHLSSFSTMVRLLDALGGNSSNPVCRGEVKVCRGGR